MPPLPVTLLTAAFLSVMLVALSLAVSFRRRDVGVATGYGQDDALMTRIRAQGNFTEYVPLGLLLLGLAEAGGATTMAWIMAAALVVGRIAHAGGMYSGRLPPRVAGMILTYTALLVGAAAAVSLAV